MFIISGSASDVSIRDLQLQGAATNSSSNQYGILTDAAAPPHSLTIRQVHFSGNDAAHGLNSAIKIDSGAAGVTVSHILVERLQGQISGRGYGVIVVGSSEIKMLDSTFLGGPGRGRHAVYLSSGVHHSIVSGNTVDCFNEEYITMNSGECSLDPEPNSYNIVGHNQLRGVTGCNQNASSALISIFGAAQFNTITGNMVDSSNASGIVINATSGAAECPYLSRHNSIIGNTIRSSQLRGIDVRGASGTRILNNVLDDNGLAESCRHANIRLVTTAAGQVVDGTVLMGNTSTGTSPRSSLEICQEPPPPTATVYSGNHFPALCFTDIEFRPAESCP